jgi:hypothetical protein
MIFIKQAETAREARMVTHKTWQDVPSIPVTREQIQEARRIVDENFPQGGMMGGYMDPQDKADTVRLMYAVHKYGYCMGGGVNMFFSYENFMLAKVVAGGDNAKVTAEFVIGVLKWMQEHGRSRGAGPIVRRT